MEMNDYIENAIKTKSPEFYGDKIALLEFQHLAKEAIKALRDLDAVKKTLFYGRDYRYSSQTFTPNMNALRDKIAHSSFTLGPNSNPLADASAQDVIHCIIGKATEAGELLELLLDVSLDHREFDEVNFIEELGDGQWYDAIGANAVDSTFESIQQTNIAKLKVRFPDRFTKDKAENRDLFAEREILETMPGL